jgi:hypothetical protein
VPPDTDLLAAKGGSVEFVDGALRARIPIVLHNAGHSPALKVRVKIDLFFRGATQVTKPAAQQDVCAKPWSDNLTVSIFPDRDYELLEILGATKETVAAGLKAMRDIPGVMVDAIGCVKYVSSVGEREGETGFA